MTAPTPRPVRVQRKRTRGYNMQAASPNGLPVVYVGRPTKFGNPFSWREEMIAGMNEEQAKICAYETYKWWIEANDPEEETPPTTQEIKDALRGKNLACWCEVGDYCHADVLLEIANAD